ncbi:hypothetical protein SALBM311S_12803 [Streptomyces alboniger]
MSSGAVAGTVSPPPTSRCCAPPAPTTSRCTARRAASPTATRSRIVGFLNAEAAPLLRGSYTDEKAADWNIGFAAADYAELLGWWAETARGSRTKLYLGEALYKAGDPAQPAGWQDPAELSRHLTLARDHPQARGHVFFAAKEVAVDRIGAMARVVADHYQRPAKPPRWCRRWLSRCRISVSGPGEHTPS